jgi:hypothetical protein
MGQNLGKQANGIELTFHDKMYTSFVALLPQVPFLPGAYYLSHSLSWTNNKENHGLLGGKVWIPEDPSTSKANGRYPTD